MRAISVRQPWAWQIIHQRKSVGLCSLWAELGGIHLVLANPRPLLVPIPCRGALGLWTPPADVLEQLQVVANG